MWLTGFRTQEMREDVRGVTGSGVTLGDRNDRIAALCAVVRGTGRCRGWIWARISRLRRW